jgi:hypothetical protein
LSENSLFASSNTLPALGIPCGSHKFRFWLRADHGSINLEMPTLFKLLAILAVLCCLALGAMMALVALVEPEHRTITVSVPLPKPKP